MLEDIKQMTEHMTFMHMMLLLFQLKDWQSCSDSPVIHTQLYHGSVSSCSLDHNHYLCPISNRVIFLKVLCGRDVLSVKSK